MTQMTLFRQTVDTYTHTCYDARTYVEAEKSLLPRVLQLVKVKLFLQISCIKGKPPPAPQCIRQENNNYTD